jgi:hypothetical protein
MGRSRTAKKSIRGVLARRLSSNVRAHRQAASYERPPSKERFENLWPRSVQIRARDGVRIRSELLVHCSRQANQFTLRLDDVSQKSAQPLATGLRVDEVVAHGNPGLGRGRAP